MNTGTVDIEYRHQLSEVLRLRFDEKLSIRAISQQVSMSHSTVHIMVQRFAKSGVPWPLPKKLSAEHLDVILFLGRRKTTKKVPETRLPSDGSWRTRPRTRYSREFKEELVRQSLQPGTSVAYLARENGINANLLFKWIRLWQREGWVCRPRKNSSSLPALIPVQRQAEPSSPTFELPSCPPPAACHIKCRGGEITLTHPSAELMSTVLRELMLSVLFRPSVRFPPAP